MMAKMKAKIKLELLSAKSRLCPANVVLNPLGKTFAVIASISLMASPRLTPAAGVAEMVALYDWLYRYKAGGLTDSCSFTRLSNDTIPPLGAFRKRERKSAGADLSFLSNCPITSYCLSLKIKYP